MPRFLQPPSTALIQLLGYRVGIPYPLLNNVQVMVIVWRLRGNIIRTAPCWVAWHTGFLQCLTLLVWSCDL